MTEVESRPKHHKTDTMTHVWRSGTVHCCCQTADCRKHKLLKKIQFKTNGPISSNPQLQPVRRTGALTALCIVLLTDVAKVWRVFAVMFPAHFMTGWCISPGWSCSPAVLQSCLSPVGWSFSTQHSMQGFCFCISSCWDTASREVFAQHFP